MSKEFEQKIDLRNDQC